MRMFFVLFYFLHKVVFYYYFLVDILGYLANIRSNKHRVV